MNKTLIIMGFILLVSSITVSADLNVTVGMDSDGGEIDAWLNANSGEGETNYYIDGENFKESISNAANSRRALVSNVYNSFMQYRRQPTGGFSWEEVSFESLEPRFQRLRFVLESWFVPRKELTQVIQQQQTQISQLQLEVEAISRMVNQEQLCNARQQVMIEMNLASVTCGDTKYVNEGNGQIIGITSEVN